MNPSELVLVTGGQNGPIVEFCRLSQHNIYNNTIENNSKRSIKHSHIGA